jgi:hypothetical protein
MNSFVAAKLEPVEKTHRFWQAFAKAGAAHLPKYLHLSGSVRQAMDLGQNSGIAFVQVLATFPACQKQKKSIPFTLKCPPSLLG